MLIKLRNIRFIVFGFLLSGLLFFFRSTSNSFAFSFPFNCPFRFAFHFPFRFSFSLPSGVDFIERAYFKEDGSGTFSIAVDFRKASNLNWFVKLLNHGQIIESIASNAFRQTQQQLQKIDGISKVDVKAPTKDMLTFELSFRFSHIQALNKAMGKINKDLDPAKITYFSLDDELFVREDINGITGKLLFYQQHDNCSVKSLRLASFFKETTYKTIYTFPRKRVKQFSNPLTSVTKNGQGVCIMITHHVFAPDQIDESIGNRVHFVKNSLKK